MGVRKRAEGAQKDAAAIDIFKAIMKLLINLRVQRVGLVVVM